jgi:ABC-type nitrate/sulfonate/bicarbonate transport system ATPase subunit
MTIPKYEKKDVILQIKDVSLTLGGHLILRDVNATIQDIVRPDCLQGQVICFLGPSGIGKTQLSKIITGLQQPTKGGVYISFNGLHPGTPVGKEFSGLQPVHKGMVGMVGQAYPFFKFMTVEDNITVAGQQAGLTVRQIQEKGLSLLNEFDIYEYRKYYAKDLSGGTRQRVAIIRQLMCSDHFIVMDEPFASLDLINKKRACDLITKIATLDELNTVIIVTHDVTEGMSVADTVWLMGLEPDPNKPGTYLPGARLVEQYDLAAQDLCWHPDIQTDPRFLSFVGEVKQRFLTLGK